MSRPAAGRRLPGEDDRVRICLACGAVLPFDEVTCSACGHAESSHPESPGEPVVACPACLQFLAASLLFCPSCGREMGAPGTPAAAGPPLVEPTAGRLPAVAVALAVIAPLLVLVALAVLAAGESPGL